MALDLDILDLRTVGSQEIRTQAESILKSHKAIGEENEQGMLFANLLGSAMNSINTTNSYLSDAENEEIKLALGETENAHDLTIALSKASTALQYTVAVRDKLLEAYKELMQINV